MLGLYYKIWVDAIFTERAKKLEGSVNRATSYTHLKNPGRLS
jgi:hypothetical protein